MSKRWWGVLALLVLSEALGVACGHWYFRTFKNTVPPAVLSSVVETTVYAVYLARGAVLGLAFFAWGFLGWVLLGATWKRAPKQDAFRKTA